MPEEHYTDYHIPNSFYTNHQNPISLCKTAQLNVHELLKYLSYKQIDDENMHLKMQKETCGAYMLNVMPKRNWITGPVKAE